MLRLNFEDLEVGEFYNWAFGGSTRSGQIKSIHGETIEFEIFYPSGKRTYFWPYCDGETITPLDKKAKLELL